ncbi:MAG TPA: phage portal protein [Acidimicrobiales bacterium]|nr:phage portal protein [Acidimicrobiales bacterium]
MVAAAVRRGGRGDSLIPPPDQLGALGGLEGPFIWDPQSARRLPAVERAVALIAGMFMQMPMDAYRAATVLPRPALLSRPDPNEARSWFVGCHVEDYLLNGNAVSLVTARNAEQWPASVMWLDAYGVSLMWDPPRGDRPAQLSYWYRGQELPPDDVIHVKRSADRLFPYRGVGVVEQHLATLDRMALEEEYERSALAGGAVPSVAVIAPQPRLDQESIDEAKAQWMSRFAGPVREPVILPNGTVIQPLAWSPTDSQLNEARQLSLTDAANMFNLSGYWVNAPTSTYRYQSAASEHTSLLRTTLEPILASFEDVWTYAWLPRGQRVHFDRSVLIQESLPTKVGYLIQLIDKGVITPDEARVLVALPATAGVEPLGVGGEG